MLRQPAWALPLAAVAYPLPAAAYPRPAQTCHRHGDDGDHPGWVCYHLADQFRPAIAAAAQRIAQAPGAIGGDAD